MLRVPYWIAAIVVAIGLSAGLMACGGDDDENGGTEATTERAADAEGADSGTDTGATDDDADTGPGNGEAANRGPARSEQIDELLALHPVFSAKRFLNFAARGDPGACSLLSPRGRKAMQDAHGKSCEDTVRDAAAGHDEPGLMIAGEFVPIEGLSDLEYRTTIYVFEREQGRVTIDGETRPMILRQYGRIWLIDQVPLAEIGTVR